MFFVLHSFHVLVSVVLGGALEVPVPGAFSFCRNAWPGRPCASTSCCLLSARELELDSIARRIARFEARCPLGRVVGLSCCNTCLSILRA